MNFSVVGLGAVLLLVVLIILARDFASRLALAPIATQIAFLSSCLAADLLVKLQFGGCGTMHEALAVIDRDYKSRNPLTV